jgi:hypothetical protein
VITIGVEYRDVNPDNLRATYEGNDAYLEELLEQSPEGGFADEGVSLHVNGTEDGHEYLRFDVFDGEPHYHYVHRGDEIVNNVVDFDVAANGDMLAWALDCIHRRLGVMLPKAGGGHLVARLDQSQIDAALAQAETMATAAQAAQRASRTPA